MTTAADLLQTLWETTLATSAAIALVLLLRLPLRRLAGRRIAYALWGVVPVAFVAVLLPAPLREAPGPADVAQVVIGAAELRSVEHAAPGWMQWAPMLLAVWLFGAILSAVVQARRQRRFVAGLGRLHARGDGLWQAESVAGLPALVGLLPKIVIPADFDARYARDERRLIVAHERMHARRGDQAANTLAAVLRCTFWFNPLLPIALERFRRDQELACDEAIVARHPASRRAYGEAMLKTELSFHPSAPLACQWSGHHPLKERIAMLRSPSPSARQWIAGTALVLGLLATTAYAAWAAQPPQVQSDSEQADADAAAWRKAVEDARVLTPPRYPQAAAEARIGGKVVLLLDIDAAGNVTGVEVESATPPGVFEANAVAAAKQWKFNPETKNGKAAASRKRVPVTFAMDGPRSPAANGHGAVEGMSRSPAPKYPKAAYEAGIGGKVVLLVDFDAAGNVTHIEVETATPPGVFDAATLEAAKQWKFEPRIENGKAMPGRTRVPVHFELDEKPAGAGGADGSGA